ncbi:ABC transporter substrate-binding protein [Anaerolineales bacterium HSG24]|nr:ABC transporter substrate-binding protein [Anaerolineales bacterium HSG24]
MMKRIYYLVAISLLLFLTGCASTGGPVQPTETPKEEPKAEAPQEETKEEPATDEKVTLTIESWRNDDLAIWQDVLIPAFNVHYPNIEVVFAPTAPAEYNSVLNTKLEGGTAGDLITCRPFDTSLGLYQAGHLVSLNDLAGMENFGSVAKSAWTTDDGSNTFCVPMASVIHGFIYNADIFAELGLSKPATESEFYAMLDAVKADGNYAPLVMGTIDQWESATMGYQNIGPNYWNGEDGRLGLIAGTDKLNDPQYVAVLESLAKWGAYMADGYEAQTYPDSQNLFTLGQGAVYPAGSWDISLFNDQADFALGAFAPPVPDGSDKCYISDHTDIGLGINNASPNAAAAKTFLEWMTTQEFAELYGNQLPGFFPLANHSISLGDPIAQEFVDWRNKCESTIRNSYQILSRGEPNLENELWSVSAQIINGTLSPADGAQQLQDGLDVWYTPGEISTSAPAEESAAPSSDVSGELLIESWRNDDLAIWEDVLIPAFNAHYPNVNVTFAPTAPAEYNSVLNTKLEGGTAGDLITCRPFDTSLGLYDNGHLANLKDLPGLSNFSDVAKSAWTTDDGSATFCMPMASVIHGFLYNADAFAELGVSEPTTESEFYALLDAIKADGTYAPLVMGTIDQWESATMGFQNIGPNYWNGEDGRLGLINGSEKLNDSQYVAVLESLAKWGAYLPDGFEAQTYPDSQNFFSLGMGAIYPAGSWDIALFNDQADFALGAFPPPVPDGSDKCYISDHTDIGLGMNTSTANAEAAKAFLDWVTTQEFAELYGNQLPGFFPLANHSISLSDPIAQEFVDWRGECESTIRNSYQILSRGEPNLENELWSVSAQVINGSLSPADGAQQLQDGLDVWYTPAGGSVDAATEEESNAGMSEDEMAAASGDLLIESWRNDDLAIWEDILIPAFNAKYPNINVTFAPTAPAEYNSVLNTKLEGGTAGDLITCRPFDTSLGLYSNGRLASLNDLAGLSNFSDVAKSAWTTDDGSVTFCVPMASVIHGFIYNADAFAELGLNEPTTEAEFFEVLEAIKADGTYYALDMGTADQWEAATMGFQNIGPNYWNGETGRNGLLDGSEKLTDPQYVATFESLAKWGPYLPDGFEAQTYPDSQNLFTLGMAAIYPAGSWDISLFNNDAEFALGAFHPPVPEGGSSCYISDHTDIGLGMNASTENADAAKVFLDWVSSAEFAGLYGNQLPGFFPLSNHSVSLSDPIAQEFVDWRDECESTIRNSYQILSRGEPNLENELWSVSAQVINGTLTPEEATEQLQSGLAKWYEPQQ